MPARKRLLISLCDDTGNWPRPWLDYGYEVRQYDLKRGQDIRLIAPPKEPVDVVLAAPVCTELSGAGARWWAAKGDAALFEALALVDACLRFVALCRPRVWALENPVGRLSRYLGRPAWTFQPYEFAALADDPEEEAYTKRTCLWGQFDRPARSPMPNLHGSKMWARYGGRSERTKALRSVTPIGFARAFCAYNLPREIAAPRLTLEVGVA